MQTADHSGSERYANMLRGLPYTHCRVAAGRSKELPHAVPTIRNRQGYLVFDYDPRNVDRLLADCPLLVFITSRRASITIYGRALFDLLRGIPCKKLELYLRTDQMSLDAFMVEVRQAMIASDQMGSIMRNEDTVSMELGGWQFTVTSGITPIGDIVPRFNVGTCGFFYDEAGEVRTSPAGLLTLLYGALVLNPDILSPSEANQLMSDFALHMPVALPSQVGLGGFVSTEDPRLGRYLHIRDLRTDAGCACGMTASELY